MDTFDSIRSRRSIRKFRQEEIDENFLMKMVDLGRLYSSAANRQPLSFALVSKKENRALVFRSLKWAGYVKDFEIQPNEEPMAYFLILERDDNRSPLFEFDAGCAATTVMLAAEAMGIQSCCLKIPQPDNVKNDLQLELYTPRYAIALGYGAIKSEIFDEPDTCIYYEKENGDFCVPKRPVNNVLIWSDLDERSKK